MIMQQGDVYEFAIDGDIKKVEIVAEFWNQSTMTDEVLFLWEGAGSTRSRNKPGHWRLVERNGVKVKDWVSGKGQDLKEGEAMRLGEWCGLIKEIDGSNVIVQISVYEDLIEVQR